MCNQITKNSNNTTSTKQPTAAEATSRVIDLEKLIEPEVVAACMLQVVTVGYAEDASVFFINVDPSIYMIHLKSMQIENVSVHDIYWFIFPYTSLYTPGILRLFSMLCGSL